MASKTFLTQIIILKIICNYRNLVICVFIKKIVIRKCCNKSGYYQASLKLKISFLELLTYLTILKRDYRITIALFLPIEDGKICVMTIELAVQEFLLFHQTTDRFAFYRKFDRLLNLSIIKQSSLKLP